MDEISRFEKILRGDPIDPVSRLEIFAAMAAGTWSGDPLTPVTRLEYFLSQISGGGGGGETKSTLIPPVIYSAYTGNMNYTTPLRQKFTAPEGVVYDKVWNADEYMSSNIYSGNVQHIVSGTSGSQYRWFDNTYVHTVCLMSASLSKIYQHNFEKSINFDKLAIYRSDAVVPLDNINAFSNTPFASGGSGGTLYVPSALISSYQSATNWSTILGYANNSIAALEGSEFKA